MRWDVYHLPPAPLAVESFAKRAESPYLTAHEDLRAAVATAIDGRGPERPLGRVSLTIICYVGSNKRDGMYRPQKVHKLHLVLDPIYRALLDERVIEDMGDVYEIRTCLVRNSAREGFRIDVQELPTAGESSRPSPEPVEQALKASRGGAR